MFYNDYDIRHTKDLGCTDRFSVCAFQASCKIYSGLTIFPATAQLAAVLGDAR